jgi:Cytochrome P460
MRYAMKAAGLSLTALLLGTLGCTQVNPRVATRLNEEASFAGDLAVNPLQWKVITSAIDHRNGTMYTVFGNDQAVAYARTHAQHDYPAGSVIALATWTQQEDARWFGGNIPKAPKSVEFVTVSAGVDQKRAYKYEDYEGSPLKKVLAQENPDPQGRAAYLISQRAAVMP